VLGMRYGNLMIMTYLDELGLDPARYQFGHALRLLLCWCAMSTDIDLYP
jgi:hypothetical protein